MSARIIACVEFECDDCGSSAWDYHEGIPHFPGTLAEGVAAIVNDYDWSVEGDEHVCFECSEQRTRTGEGRS